jgi:hypothetical protein
MSSGPEGQQLPSPRGRIYDGICSDACVIQDPLTLQAGPYMTMPSLDPAHDRAYIYLPFGHTSPYPSEWSGWSGAQRPTLSRFHSKEVRACK